MWVRLIIDPSWFAERPSASPFRLGRFAAKNLRVRTAFLDKNSYFCTKFAPLAAKNCVKKVKVVAAD